MDAEKYMIEELVENGRVDFADDDDSLVSKAKEMKHVRVWEWNGEFYQRKFTMRAN